MMEADLSEFLQVPLALLDGITFGISTTEENEKISVLAINAVVQVTDSKLGLPNPTSQCSTCGYKDLKSCEGHFGIIKFPFTVLHPYFVSEVVQILNKICPGCKSVRKDVLIKRAQSARSQILPRGCKYCLDTSTGWYPKMKFKISSEGLRRAAIKVEIIERSSKKFKNNNLEKNLPSDYWDVFPNDESADESFIKPKGRLLTFAQVHHLLKNVDPSFIKQYILNRDSVFLNCFPVTPNGHRVTEVAHVLSNGQRLVFDERTRAYKKLVDFRGLVNTLSFHVLDCLNTSKIKPDNLRNGDDPVRQNVGSGGRSGTSGLRWVKDILLGKRNDHAFRMVVVGDPNLKLCEIGVPCHVAERLHISEVLTARNWERISACCEVRLLEKGEIHVRRDGCLVRVRSTEQLHLFDTVYRPLHDGDLVLINRPPSIHQHSLLSLSVRVLPSTSVLAINPLCCPPLRGDFDGDCLHGFVPQSVAARAELRELVALDKQLVNAQNGLNLLSFTQDSLVAAHLLLENETVLNPLQVQQLLILFPPPPPPPPPHSLGNACSWTGKQLMSMLLPSNDGEVISCEGVGVPMPLQSRLVNGCPRSVLDFFCAAQQVLCEWLSTRGLSVSLLDFSLCAESWCRGNLTDEVLCGIQEAGVTCRLHCLLASSRREGDELASLHDPEQLCFEKQRSAALSRACADSVGKIFHDIQSLALTHAGSDNSLLAMMRSGSKGNPTKLVQHSMCLGLQQSQVPLSFRMPGELSCDGWNRQRVADASACAVCYVPSAVVEASFLSGLNPLECFIHSVANRDGSFSDNADLPGSLNRKLMFFLRDLYVAYDGTVRNQYGNHLVQFSYHDSPADINGTCGAPVGSWAACSVSEAAYSSLDQPISLLGNSPLINLMRVMECGLKRNCLGQSFSLFLSDKLSRHRNGFERGALAVQNHLEKLLFSDVVSVATIMHTPQGNNEACLNPWVLHFHMFKEVFKKKNLKLRSVIDSLYKQCGLINDVYGVQIKCGKCAAMKKELEERETMCIAVNVVEKAKSPCTKLEKIQCSVIPFLLKTVLKGFVEIKKVKILWKEKERVEKSKLHDYPCGELYLKVSMYGKSDQIRLWNKLIDFCLPIMNLIDWARSHPDNIHDFCLAFGIAAGWRFFLDNLVVALSDIGKTILKGHLKLVASLLSITGEFVGLNARGLKQQRELLACGSPFMQACFSNPGSVFIKAAKVGVTDDLCGCLDALAWGKIPPIGTGQFDVIYANKDYAPKGPIDVYNHLGSQVGSHKPDSRFEIPSILNHHAANRCATSMHKFGGYEKGLKAKTLKNISASFLKSFVTHGDIQKLSRSLSKILFRYALNERLNERDKAALMMALYFHPRRDDKIGMGVKDIKVVNHPEYKDSRCFSLVRTDGTTEDFSYRKCVHRALEIIAPESANRYREKHLGRPCFPSKLDSIHVQV